jgi:hypothetical protein
MRGEVEPSGSYRLCINHHQMHHPVLPTKKLSNDLAGLRWMNDEPKLYASTVMRFTIRDINASVCSG